jgi:hypothetical protein
MTLLNKVLNLPLGQEDVEFLIPDVDLDRRLGIDPFLFYRSTKPEFQDAHSQLLIFFNEVLAAVASGNLSQAEYLLISPEPNEIGLGYSKRGSSGRGIGPEYARQIAATFRSSPALLSRGLRHIEELQLVCPGIGPDRVSDLTANVLKLTLIKYTQEQCRLWNIPVQCDVPISHFFDFENLRWSDGYFELPTNPTTGGSMIFVPRRVLRILPWINYDDYLGDFRKKFLRPTTKRNALRLKARKPPGIPTSPNRPGLEKEEVCTITQKDTSFLDAYVDRKERDADQAVPSELRSLEDSTRIRSHAEALKQQLRETVAGREDAYIFQDLVQRILTFCFYPHLNDGTPQERTADGTVIRDLVFTNEGTRNFWRYLLATYGNLFLVFELKNKNEIDGRDVDQISTYLGDTLGRFGVLISRRNEKDVSFRRRKYVFNKEVPRKVILHLCDQDLLDLLECRATASDVTDFLQTRYRQLMVLIE